MHGAVWDIRDQRPMGAACSFKRLPIQWNSTLETQMWSTNVTETSDFFLRQKTVDTLMKSACRVGMGGTWLSCECQPVAEPGWCKRPHPKATIQGNGWEGHIQATNRVKGYSVKERNRNRLLASSLKATGVLDGQQLWPSVCAVQGKFSCSYKGSWNTL